MKKIKCIVMTLLSILTLSFTLPPITAVYANENHTPTFTEKDINSTIPIFEAIIDTPDELLTKGTSDEIKQYYRQKGIYLNVYNDNIGEDSSNVSIITPRTNYFRCGLALGQLFLTVAIPATQITKIKKYIQALGGVWEAAQLLVGATTASEKTQGALAALSGILLTLTGIADIKEHCFG